MPSLLFLTRYITEEVTKVHFPKSWLTVFDCFCYERSYQDPGDGEQNEAEKGFDHYALLLLGAVGSDYGLTGRGVVRILCPNDLDWSETSQV